MANTYSLEHNISLIYRNAETGLFEEFLPKTIDTQIVCIKNKNAHDHVTSDEHINSFDREALNNSGTANGLVVLDENGMIPLDKLSDSLVSIKIEYTDISDMLSQSASVLPGALVMVVDATADSTVKRGWAVYRRNNSGSYSSLSEGWTKIAENESLDIEAEWSVFDTPSSSVEEIDATVARKHYHDNKAYVLDHFADDGSGGLTYKGIKIAYMSKVTKFLEGDYLKKGDQRLGDFWLKPTVGQTWWNDPSIEEAGVTCVEKYSNYDTMVTSPKLNTVNTTNMRKMFYRCYDLENVEQYDTRKVVDFSGMFQECSSLVSVPFMSTLSGTNFDDMFNGCARLDHTPELDLDSAISVKNFCNGCVNLRRVLPFGSTRNVINMLQMFNDCESLETIDSPIDFTSVIYDDNVVDMFSGCQELKDVKVVENSIKVSISFNGTNLSEESVISVLEGLAQLDSGVVKTLDLRDIDSVRDIDESEFQTAINKGWEILKSVG